ncbi:hypothetical protein PFLmoz3_03540 [Pseudomonas fluorescens]|uniref:Uncharacterized protein n=1 Tax=Pseudomonas fluorescens TaxID=294 RepID=A0A120G776_PSEFL|nr:hypothetical protein PFLmoz3_03540 [Pseudomonas fluorescens]
MRCWATNAFSSSSNGFMIAGSPWISYGPFSSIRRIPLSLTLPATIPENARRRLAANSWGGSAWLSCRLAMFSWVGSNGRWKPSSIFSSQLKWNASLRSRRNCFTALRPVVIWRATSAGSSMMIW